jgi:hypothetical protein
MTFILIAISGFAKDLFYADDNGKVKKFEGLSFEKKNEDTKEGLYALKDINQQRLMGDPVFYKGMLIGTNISGEGESWYDFGITLWGRPIIQLFKKEL